MTAEFSWAAHDPHGVESSILLGTHHKRVENARSHIAEAQVEWEPLKPRLGESTKPRLNSTQTSVRIRSLFGFHLRRRHVSTFVLRERVLVYDGVLSGV
jgi:hypothetical protein